MIRDKPMGRKNYGSIPHLPNSNPTSGDRFINKGQAKILIEKTRDKHDYIIVTEKYDGSNVGVGKKDGSIHALTRKGYAAETSLYKQHQLFAEWVRENESLFQGLLDEGSRISGEWLAQVHSIHYNVGGRAPIVFFDHFSKENKRMEFLEFQRLCLSAGLPTARVIYSGWSSVTPLSLFVKLNKKDDRFVSVGVNPEGMIYRVQRKGVVDFLAKWVRPDFKPGVHCINVEENNLKWNVNQKLYDSK